MGSDWTKCQSPNILNGSGTDDAECRRNVGSVRRVGDAIRSMVNDRGLHEAMHDSEKRRGPR